MKSFRIIKVKIKTPSKLKAKFKSAMATLIKESRQRRKVAIKRSTKLPKVVIKVK